MIGQLKKLGLSSVQLFGLAIFISLGLGHKFIANENFTTLIPYSAQSIDKDNRNVSPFARQEVSSLHQRHWLGTDPLGRDVLAGILAGTKIALLIGVTSILLAFIIGCLLGYLSGYYGDQEFSLSRKHILIGCLSLISCGFYIYYGSSLIKWIAASLLLIILNYLASKGNPKPKLNSIAIPFDIIITRLIEIFKAVPDVFIILILLALFRSTNYWNVILVIALIRWPMVTRYLRAEIFKLKEQEYISSAKAIGLPHWKIFLDHILPLAIGPVIVSLAFGFSTAILLESTLSFLGIGVPVDKVTWGSLLNLARHNFSSWWLAIFPGLAIFSCIYLFNSIGNNLNEYFTGYKDLI